MNTGRTRIALAALVAALSAGAVGTSYALGASTDISAGSGTKTVVAADLSQGAPLKVSLIDQDDPEARGACIHSVSTARMCNEITRRYCFSAMFVKASFYEDYTCDQAKNEGLY